MNNYKYWFFGSIDSTDTDVLLLVDNIPNDKNDCINLVKKIKKELNTDWNINLITFEESTKLITNTIASKGTIDNIQNSLYYTYNLHKQDFPNIVEFPVKRNKLLNIYRCFRTVLTYLTRTQYRTDIKPILKYCHNFDSKIEALRKINFNTIDSFGAKYSKDTDIWKTITFYFIQSLCLLNDIEVYTKDSAKTMLVYYKLDLLKDLIDRKEILIEHKDLLNTLKEMYLQQIDKLKFISNGNTLYMNDEKIDMFLEKELV